MSLVFDIFEKEHWDALNVTVRWNGVRRNQNESLRDHLYTAMLIADVLLEEIFPDSTKSYLSEFKLKVLRSVGKHDIDEIFSGDVLHSVKYNPFNGEQFRAMLSDYVNWEMKNNFDKNIPSHKMILDSLNYFGDESVKKFVKLCDWLSCILYIYNEKSLGNTNFDKYLPRCKAQLMASIDDLKITMSYYHKVDMEMKVFEDLKQFFNKKIAC